MKIYARQIPPEEQESPLDIFSIDTDYINLTGNRNYNKHVSLLFESVRDALHDGEISEVWNEDNRDGTLEEAIKEILPPSGRMEYTHKEAWKMAEIATDYYYGADENKAMCALLSIVTGKEWKYKTLHGCCQSDWVYAFYPADAWTPETLEAFEAEYFNTGTEWIIHEGGDAPENPDEIEGYSMYCHTYNPRSEIAAIHNTEPENVTLYEFSGYTRTACYKVV